MEETKTLASDSGEKHLTRAEVRALVYEALDQHRDDTEALCSTVEEEASDLGTYFEPLEGFAVEDLAPFIVDWARRVGHEFKG